MKNDDILLYDTGLQFGDNSILNTIFLQYMRGENQLFEEILQNSEAIDSLQIDKDI